MFQLSLSSKELFHTNFLYWLATNYRKEFQSALSNLGVDFNKIPAGWVAKREFLHFDFCLIAPKQKNSVNSSINEEDIDENNFDKSNYDVYLIIENKVKSIPSFSQLHEYSTKRPNAQKLLLTLTPAAFVKPKSWKENSYLDLSNELVKINTIKDSYHNSILQDYSNFTRTLHCIFQMWEIKNITQLYDDVAYRKCQDVRLHDLYEKQRYSQMCYELRAMLANSGITTVCGFEFPPKNSKTKTTLTQRFVNEEVSKNPESVFLNFGYTKSMGLLECKIWDNKRNCIWGIQIQGKQYRHYIEFLKSSPNNVKKAQSISSASNNFFGQGLIPLNNSLFDPNHPFSVNIGTKKSSLKGYCQFGNVFFYKYMKICHPQNGFAKSNVQITDILQYMHEDIKAILSAI